MVKIAKTGNVIKNDKHFKGIYKIVKARVIIGNRYTESFDCPWGVKQGCILSKTEDHMT